MDNPAQPVYLPYLKAMPQLIKRLNATPEELAMWLFYGELKAYFFNRYADNSQRYEQTCLPGGWGDFDYQKYLQGMYFLADDIQQFKPNERYITGETLIARWGKNPVITDVRHFIGSKICESRLDDRHPTHGGTAATREAFSAGTLPPLEQGLFSLSDVEAIEAEDFDEEFSQSVGQDKDELPEARRARLKARIAKEKAKGTKAFNQVVADEEGISVSRLKQLTEDKSPPPTAIPKWGGLSSQRATPSQKKTKSQH